MTLTEAAACGTPSVATDIAGHRDAVVDEETGLLVDDGDLGAALARVLRDDELRRRLGAAGRARAARLTWSRTATRLFSLLDTATLLDEGSADGVS